MSEDLKHIKSLIEQSDSHISYDVMEKYIAGTLTYKEQHDVEKEVLANDMLADALEGLREARSNVARENIEDINRYIDGLVGEQKNRKISYYKLAGIAAAAILLIVSSVAIVDLTADRGESLAKTEASTEEYRKDIKPTSQRKEKQLYQEGKAYEWKKPEEEKSEDEENVVLKEAEEEVLSEPEEIAAELDSSEEIVAVGDSYQISPDSLTLTFAGASTAVTTSDSNIEEKEAITLNNTYAVSESRSMTNNKIKKPEAQIALEIIAYGKLSSPTLTKKEVRQGDPAYGKDSYNYKTVDKTDQERAAGNGANFLAEAVEAFNKGDYKSAASKFDIVLSSDPNNEKANIYGGVAHLKINNPVRAEDLLEKVSTATYSSHAEWYLSAAYIQNGKTNKAEKILKKLDQSSVYKDKAVEMLDQLQ